MNEETTAPVAPSKQHVLVSAIFTPFLAIVGLGLIFLLLGTAGSSGDPYAFIAVPFMFGAGTAASAATAIASPFFLRARIVKPRHAGVIAVVATFGSYLLFLSGFTPRLVRLVTGPNSAEVYEPLVGAFVIHVGLIALLCLFYRTSRFQKPSQTEPEN